MKDEQVTINEAQEPIEGTTVARMIMDFHRQLRDVYRDDVHASMLCAVGPLQSMIGLAIKNGYLVARESRNG